jgi:hypothetical protein
MDYKIKHSCHLTNCNGECRVISPYNFPHNYTRNSQKQMTLEAVKLFLQTDRKQKQYIFDNNYINSNKSLYMLINWCNLKNKGICDFCQCWNHETHLDNCMNHPIIMRQCARNFMKCNYELNILPDGVDNIVACYLFMKIPNNM